LGRCEDKGRRNGGCTTHLFFNPIGRFPGPSKTERKKGQPG
jgi:hypothetical protein